MDRNGIQLRGDKVDITVNKDFNVMANRVNDKVGKDEIINRLNLSPEGLDIDVNKVGIRGGDSTNYIYLSQDKIEMVVRSNVLLEETLKKIMYLCERKEVFTF